MRGDEFRLFTLPSLINLPPLTLTCSILGVRSVTVFSRFCKNIKYMEDNFITNYLSSKKFLKEKGGGECKKKPLRNVIGRNQVKQLINS